MQTLVPGNMIGVPGTVLYMIMMTLSAIVGLFITSLFISFIINGFQNKLENLSRGRSKVIESDHVLILGWDKNIYVIINELVEANKSIRNAVIVILSKRDSMDMSRDIKDNIDSLFNTKVICRSGSIYKKQDLDMCNISKAKSVIILENDINTIKALLVVSNSSFYNKKEGHVTVILEDEKNIEVARNIGKEKLCTIFLKNAITRIMTQTCLQPGLSYVYNELLDFEGNEIYFYDAKKLIGKNFGEATIAFNNAVVIGMVRDEKILVKPRMNTEIIENDQLIVIAEDEDTAHINDSDIYIKHDFIKNYQRTTSKSVEQISIIGFNENAVNVLEELDNYLLEGSEINILVNSEEYVKKIDRINDKCGNFDIKTHIGNTHSWKVLDNFIKPDCKYVIVFYNDNVPFNDKDSGTLLTLLHIRDIEEKYKININVISEIVDVSNTEIIDLAKVDDFIISEIIANKMLVQISENRMLIDIFEHLMSSEGSEIYLKPVKDYVEINTDLTFYEVTKSANVKEEIAIGYKLNNAAHISEIKINPDKNSIINFGENDMIIVISED